MVGSSEEKEVGTKKDKVKVEDPFEKEKELPKDTSPPDPKDTEVGKKFPQDFILS